ncbi:MAG TPA: uroporphyrinogen-III synthase [Actinomycetota bacterium]|nr:uroporphyrinogen-III synthase [Actinomycetota bacterium]
MNERPLAGRRVVVTRPESKGDDLAAALEALGAEVITRRTVEVAPPESWDPLDRALRDLAGFARVLFASTAAVDAVVARAAHLGIDLGGIKTGAVGEATAARLQAHGVAVDVLPERFTAVDLADALGPGRGRVLFPRVEAGPRAAIDALERAGWAVHEVAAYRNLPRDVDDPGLFDVVTFTSPSAVEPFARVAPPDRLPAGAAVVCIGPSTAAAAKDEGYSVAAVARPHTLKGLVEAVVEAAGTGRTEMRTWSP